MFHPGFLDRTYNGLRFYPKNLTEKINIIEVHSKLIFMKLNYFLKSLALTALVGLAGNVKAATITVPDGATDIELAAALNQAQTGDVILINGWVTMNTLVHVDKNITIKAGVDVAGFDGKGLSRLFEIHPEVIDGAKLVFEELGFIGGNGWGSGNGIDTEAGGGAARIYGGTTEFNFCYFENNIAQRGGAIMVTESGTMVKFKSCEAQDNIAQTKDNLNINDCRGGYLFSDGETRITHEFCKITSNQSIGGRGGALCLFGNGTHHFYYTVLSDNKGGNWSDDGTKRLDKDGNVITNGEYEGGLGFITGGATTFESCGIIANRSFSHGGIIRGIGSSVNVTFINSTITNNQSMHDRAPIWASEGGTYTFVNSLFVENLGQNLGNGAGFDGDDHTGIRLNIINSVFERNIAGEDGAVDIRAIPDYATQLTVKNSLIGLIQGNTSGVVPQDNASIPAKSNIAMYKLANEDSQPNYTDDKFPVSGVNYDEGISYSKAFGMPYYLLQANSTVTRLGDPALLLSYDIASDLFEQLRTPAVDGSITAAPTLASVTDKYDDTPIVPGPSTGIFSPKATEKGIRIICASNGILGIDFGDLKGLAKGTLVAVTGQEVETVFNIAVVGKGYYNMHVTPGVYILKVETGGKTYVQKLFVTK